MSHSHFGQVRLRAFQAQDLEPVVDLWNQCLPKDPISIERFWRLFLLDPNFRPEGALVAECDGSPVGFLQAMVRRLPLGIYPFDPAQGWITVFFVAPEHRRRGIGRSLVSAGLAVLREHGCRTVSCNGYAPSYVFPGIDLDYGEGLALMESAGFQPVAGAVAMSMPLKGVSTPAGVLERRRALASEGVVVGRFEIEDTLPLLCLAEQQFPYWHQSVVEALQFRSGNVFVARKAGSVLGFAQWENPSTDPPSGAPGRFGPFGVHPDFRGNGLGSVLFYTLIEQVASSRAETLWFGWAGGRNQSFYERAGCHITRRYRIVRRRE